MNSVKNIVFDPVIKSGRIHIENHYNREDLICLMAATLLASRELSEYNDRYEEVAVNVAKSIYYKVHKSDVQAHSQTGAKDE